MTGVQTCALPISRFARAADWFAAEEARRRAEGGRIALTETRGEVEIPAPAGPFRLHARVDRIDRLPDGRVAIYDYKTGAPPTKKQVRAFARQLPLTAVIAAAGGFEDLGPVEAGRLEYVGVTGAGPGGEARPLDLAELSPAATREELAALIAAYDDPATPYPSRLRPAFLSFAGDYDQLARLGEWSATGEDA